MSDREALLASVLADPDDDAPRLILADWLDEHGECERAAWIRTQIGVERGTIDASEEERLWDIGTQGGGFLEVPGYYGRVHWIRGFIEQITCSMSDAAQHLDAIVKEHPIRRVEFTDGPGLGFDFRPIGNGNAIFCGKNYPGIEFVLPPEPLGGFLVPEHIARNIEEMIANRWAERIETMYAQDESAIIHGTGTNIPRGTISYPRLR